MSVVIAWRSAPIPPRLLRVCVSGPPKFRATCCDSVVVSFPSSPHFLRLCVCASVFICLFVLCLCQFFSLAICMELFNAYVQLDTHVLLNPGLTAAHFLFGFG